MVAEDAITKQGKRKSREQKKKEKDRAENKERKSFSRKYCKYAEEMRIQINRRGAKVLYEQIRRSQDKFPQLIFFIFFPTPETTLLDKNHF